MGQIFIAVLMIFIGLVAFYLGVVVLCIGMELKYWNHGKCPRCHQPWRQFDVDSQGGVGYTCKCNNYIWLTLIGPHSNDDNESNIS